jgi:two-component system, sensor histidine kinase and response regulator
LSFEAHTNIDDERLMAKRILCIEDDSGTRASIRLMLEESGYEIQEAENGKTGVDLALKMLPDLIVCDIRMPGWDGFETLEELRKHESTAHIPFIFLTGEDPRTHLRKGMNLGASDFLFKPIDIDDFTKAVQVRLEEAEKRKSDSQRAMVELSERITRSLPHELRTPMTGILGMAELLKLRVEVMTPEEIKDFVKSLYDSALRMNQTLEKFWIHTQCLLLANNQELLSASRRVGTQDAQIIITRIAENLASSSDRITDLTLHLSPMSLAVTQRYFEQIMQQLIDNAFKFSPAGSPVSISSTHENETGIITIKDIGRGMSEEQIQKIHMFMQFEREHHEQQGLGLGLMIAKRLTELHGGSIQVESLQGKGTTITLTLPNIPGKELP